MQPNIMPFKFSPEQKIKACEELLAKVRGGSSLLAACKTSDDWTPSEATFRRWCDEDAELAAEYARARDDRADLIFEQCLTIADSQEGDVITVDGVEQTNHDAINRARLRIDTRKWMLGKMQPKKYGDKIELNVTKPMNEEDLDAAIAAKLASMAENGQGPTS